MKYAAMSIGFWERPIGQASDATDATATFFDRAIAFVQTPGVPEVLLVCALAGCVLIVWGRLSSLVRNAQARSALQDYLLGVEQALQGDHGGAEKRLRRVLEQDPENHYARMMLGKVLGQRGQAEQAHQQHLYLQKAFAVESAENELLLAQSLLAAGLPADSAEVAERAMTRMPANMNGWAFLYQARLQQGDRAAALRAGRRALALARRGDEQRRWRRELARTYADQGMAAWRTGDPKAAVAAAKDARLLDGEHGQVALLKARIDGMRRDVDDVARSIAAPIGERGVACKDGDEAGVASPGDHLRRECFSGLLEPARWVCRACDAPLDRALLRCSRCGAGAPAELCEPALVAAIDAPMEIMDRIDVNDAHVRRSVRAFLAGAEARRDELMALGDAAVPELLRAACNAAEQDRATIASLIVEMGAEVVPALFAASEALSQSKVWGLGEDATPVLQRIVQQLGRDALPHMQPLFHSARGDHRRVLIDYFLGLRDVEAFQSVLERFPPMEILHQINAAPAPVLEAFLRSIPRGHFLVESILLEPTFYRDEALLAAVSGADDPEVLVAVMLRRGPTRALVDALIEGTTDEALAATSMRILEEFGDRVLEHCLAGFASPVMGGEGQHRLARVLVRGGGAAAAHIADGFGPEPSHSDEQLRRLLVIIGDDGVDAMVAAYERSGWLEKVSVGLLPRHNNRRVQIVRSLAELGTRPANKALKSLIKREKDDNLRIHLQHALHGAEGGHG